MHVHKWVRKKARPLKIVYTDTDIKETYTLILLKCSKCGKHKTAKLQGTWTLEELNK
jgi:translation initiation factor 2 beta subunit (eIF-2beta)/eIF-5